jgi:hypothetical protein
MHFLALSDELLPEEAIPETADILRELVSTE